MKKIDPDQTILIPRDSQPVRTQSLPRHSASEPSKPQTPSKPKSRNWKERIHDAAMPVAGITAAIVASTTNATAAQPPAVAAPTHPSSSTDVGTLGQHPNLSKADLERFIRSKDLLDAIAPASQDLPADNPPAPIHTGGAKESETSRGWLGLLGVFLIEDAEEIAKDLLKEPIKQLIVDHIILRYAPRAVKKLYSKESGREEQAGYTPYNSRFAESLAGFRALPVYPQFGTLLKLNQEPAHPTESGDQPAGSAFADSETHAGTPKARLPAEHIRALEEENSSLRARIEELQNAKQPKPRSPSGGVGHD